VGHFWKSLLTLIALVLVGACSSNPEQELSLKLPSYFIFTGENLENLGGWAALDLYSTGPLQDPVFLIPWGGTFFVETPLGLGHVTMDGPNLRWHKFTPTIQNLKGYWVQNGLFVFAKLDELSLYRWSPFGAPEPVLIPTRLAQPDEAKLVRVELVDGEWLMEWGPPLRRVTLFHARVGLERQLTSQEVVEKLRRLAPRRKTEIPPDYQPYLPSGGFRLLINDDRLDLSPGLYQENSGPTFYGLRTGNEVWILSPDASIRGSGGEAKLKLGGGVRLSGLGAISSGLVVVWQKAVRGNQGHWGMIHVPWQFLKNRGIVER
jgi:hypothetical protein